MLIAITRAVSASITRCELTHLERAPIDVEKAEAQHRGYEDCLRDLGATVVSLPAETDFPDAVFVEDPAVVVEEAAVMTRLGAQSRRGESASLAEALGRYRQLIWMREPATLEGGDVMRLGRTLYVGLSGRTNAAGIAQLGEALEPFGYSVKSVAMEGCLHLKSACTALDAETILANRDRIDVAAFAQCKIVDVPAGEPGAANVLAIGRSLIVPACYPQTAALLEGLGWRIRAVDISELMKAEGAVTCSSLVFTAEPQPS